MTRQVRQQLRKLAPRRRCVSEGAMKTALGLGVMTAVLATVGCTVAVGWAYEGPRRFIRRLRLRKALR